MLTVNDSATSILAENEEDWPVDGTMRFAAEAAPTSRSYIPSYKLLLQALMPLV